MYHLFPVRSPERDALQAHLRRAGIETLIHYPVPLDGAAGVRGIRAQATCPVAAAAARELLSLPLYPRLTDADVVRVARRRSAHFGKDIVLA